jgi:hypothetical protein
MKKILLAIVCVSTLMAATFADYELKDDQFKGEITLKNGKSRSGYIDLKGGVMSPWLTQQSVKFFTEEAISDGKLKNNEKEKFKPKDLKSFTAGDRTFDVLKVSASKFTSGIGLPQNKFVEKLVSGKVTLYKLYEAPDPMAVTVGEAQAAAHEAELERMRNNPVMLLQKEGEKLTPIGKINLSEYLSDCAEVVAKYESGNYGVEPFNQDASSKLGKMIANKTNSIIAGDVLEEILNDYNACN